LQQFLKESTIDFERVHPRLEPVSMNKPGIAAVLSLIVPGVGQIYNGAFLRGLFWLVITPGFWIGSGGWLGWVCHLIAAYTAYTYAVASERGQRVRR
jgi:TM2 domain-containing membrane protein YozV